MRKITARVLIAGLALAAMLPPWEAAGQVNGTIIKTDNGRNSGQITWNAASKVYKVKTASSATVVIKLDEVRKLEVEKPAGFDAAVDSIRKKNYGSVGTLERIMKSYAMLEWDAKAARWLADAYLKQGKPELAVDMCEKVIQSNPGAAAGDMAEVYWEALLQTKQNDKLGKALVKGIQRGDRRTAAIAQMKRGDMDKEKGKTQEALIDGYLRTAVMFQDIKDIQAEALYKSAECFKDLGQHSHAEKMRKKLLAEYPDSPYTKRISTGA